MDTATTKALKPSDQVLNYLAAKYDLHGRHASEVALPTMREIAGSLSVSLSTVQNVYKRLGETGAIRTQKGSGSYIPATDASSHGTKIAINANFDQEMKTSYGWGSLIVQHVFCEASRRKENISMTGFDLCHMLAGGKLSLKDLPEADGYIFLPYGVKDAIREAMARIQAPCVHITPYDLSGTSNFVSPDFCSAAVKAARAWRQCGRKRILYLHHAPFSNLADCLEILKGFAYALGDEVTDSSKFLTLNGGGVEIKDGVEAAARCLAQGFAPDAVFTSSDPLAIGFAERLREAGHKIPEDVSVIGGTGFNPERPELPGLTRMAQPFAELAVAAVETLCGMINTKTHSVPGRFLSMGFIGGRTTTEAENRLLEIKTPERRLQNV